MRDFIITTDTGADLPDEYIRENQLPILQLYSTIDGVTYGYQCPAVFSSKSFYDQMRAGSVAKTQQINPEQAQDIFGSLLEQGLDVLHIGFSSGLSGSTNSCRIAAQELLERYPERKIVIVDSLCASLGQGLLVHYALQKKAEGLPLEELAAWLEETKLHICHYFTVEDLVYLQRGGRVSKTAAFVGGMIGIKPVLHVDEEGKLVPVAKVRGRKQSLTALVDYMERQVGAYRDRNSIVFISHGDSEEDARLVAGKIEERLGCKNFLFHDIGPVIGAHAGPGTIALFFLGDKR